MTRPSANSRQPLDTTSIRAARGPRAQLAVDRPSAQLWEWELSAARILVPTATVFLTNRECPFTCVMCDLWKNTLTERVPLGAIPAQIDYALRELSTPPPPQPLLQIKLYNSGNFFDPQAIPREDYPVIAKRVTTFETVIVENHPRLCGDDCRRFRDLVSGQLEVAMGLETVHPEVLPQLNKQMTVDDFDRAAEFLLGCDIAVRAFVLLAPPFLESSAAEEWCLRSVAHAFEAGARVCSIIPTRGGNGIMEQLSAQRQFHPPQLTTLERVLETTIGWQRGRVFADLWDAARFSECEHCLLDRIRRIETMNQTQQVPVPIHCSFCRE